jgi:hypothetical protein
LTDDGSLYTDSLTVRRFFPNLSGTREEKSIPGWSVIGRRRKHQYLVTAFQRRRALAHGRDEIDGAGSWHGPLLATVVLYAGAQLSRCACKSRRVGLCFRLSTRRTRIGIEPSRQATVSVEEIDFC